MRPIFTILLTLLTAMTPIDTSDIIQRTPKVRPATQAGSFYDSDPKRLTHEVDSLLERHTGTPPRNDVAALIVPHAGYYFSGNVAAAAYATLDPSRSYKRVFLIGPSHYEWLRGASVNTENDYYSTPLGQVKVDIETCKHLTAVDSVFTYRAEAHDREHCIEVQMPFLQRRLSHVPPIVPIIVNTNDYGHLKRMADALRPYFNRDNLFVISSDFSHYPSYNDALEVDSKTRQAIESGDIAELLATLDNNARSKKSNLATSACGEQAIIILMLMLDGQHTISHLLYQNSGDASSHDHSRVVGYHAFAVFHPETKTTGEQREHITSEDTTFILTDAEKATLKEIALGSIRTAFDSTSYTPRGITSTLRQHCGAFVSLMKHGRLRGCMGSFNQDTPLYEMIHEMARAAAFEDPRFHGLRQDELPAIKIEISVLTPMRRIHSLDEFQLHRHGIYIRKGYRSGTFLPQVADEVNWTKEEFVGHCSQDKAGLGWDGWRDAELYVYEAIVF